jgi:Peptidase_C39 like family
VLDEPVASRGTEAAVVQLNGMLVSGALDRSIYDGARLSEHGVPIFDVNGELLMRRYALEDPIGGYVDVAEHAALGSPLVAVGLGDWWPSFVEEDSWSDRARRAADESDSQRLVAYSFPKLALQFMRDDQESELLELGSWEPVPPTQEREPGQGPGNFERWSWLGELRPDDRERRQDRFERVSNQLLDLRGQIVDGDGRLLSADVWGGILAPLTVTKTAELRYSRRVADHVPCYEVRGQETSLWCVGASVQMILDFYRYCYDQDRIAAELGLGTRANPTGLPYGQESKVVDTIAHLTSQALTTTMANPTPFSRFSDEIDANRPAISFIPGHARTVAGYTHTRSPNVALHFEGLLVYDPWPPNAGLITRWENFAVMTYRTGFTTQLTII